MSGIEHPAAAVDAAAINLPTPTLQRRLSAALVWLLAIAAALAVASVYYLQPLLDPVADEFGISRAATGIIFTVTQVGYGLGLLLLVPLGDLFHRRTLIIRHSNRTRSHTRTGESRCYAAPCGGRSALDLDARLLRWR